LAGSAFVMHSEQQNRVLNYAILASLILHGAILSGVPPRERMPMAEPPPLVARLVEPPVPLAPPPPVLAPAPPEAVKPAPRPKPAAPKPIAKAPAPEAPAPLIEAKPEAPQPEAREAEGAAPAAPEPAPPAAIAPSEPADPAPDQTSVAQYRLQLISAARKFKNYPRVAMENNWEGDVVVRMAFGGNGALAGLSVQSSSGHKVLDQQALEMFKRAAAAVFVPPALQGREFSFEVRAVYNLKDQASG
jgi:protein TonB